MALRFQSAMRIFCCSNSVLGASTNRTAIGFNPPCGFFVVRTSRSPPGRRPPTAVSIRHADFLLFERDRLGERGIGEGVSIRHADFLLFERQGLPA